MKTVNDQIAKALTDAGFGVLNVAITIDVPYRPVGHARSHLGVGRIGIMARVDVVRVSGPVGTLLVPADIETDSPIEVGKRYTWRSSDFANVESVDQLHLIGLLKT